MQKKENQFILYCKITSKMSKELYIKAFFFLTAEQQRFLK